MDSRRRIDLFLSCYCCILCIHPSRDGNGQRFPIFELFGSPGLMLAGWLNQSCWENPLRRVEITKVSTAHLELQNAPLLVCWQLLYHWLLHGPFLFSLELNTLEGGASVTQIYIYTYIYNIYICSFVSRSYTYIHTRCWYFLPQGIRVWALNHSNTGNCLGHDRNA